MSAGQQATAIEAVTDELIERPTHEHSEHEGSRQHQEQGVLFVLELPAPPLTAERQTTAG